MGGVNDRFEIEKRSTATWPLCRGFAILLAGWWCVLTLLAAPSSAVPDEGSFEPSFDPLAHDQEMATGMGGADPCWEHLVDAGSASPESAGALLDREIERFQVLVERSLTTRTVSAR